MPAPKEFVAWTVYADPSGTISSLPPGRAAAPVSQFDRTYMVYWKVLNAYLQLPATRQVFLASPVQPQISPGQRISALASNGNTLQINSALAELISDSPSELAFVMAHEMGHIYQQRSGQLIWRADDREWDADYWGLAMSRLAGYDPYAGAGALAKLAMATNTSGYCAIEPGVSSTVDLAHASGADRRENLVWPEARTRGKRHTALNDSISHSVKQATDTAMPLRWSAWQETQPPVLRKFAAAGWEAARALAMASRGA